MHAGLIHHLLILWAHCPRDRRIWLDYFRTETAGMPRGYADRLIRWLIGAYPADMAAIIHHRPAAL